MVYKSWKSYSTKIPSIKHEKSPFIHLIQEDPAAEESSPASKKDLIYVMQIPKNSKFIITNV